MAQTTLKIQEYEIDNLQQLNQLEQEYRHIKKETQFMPWAKGVSYQEISEDIKPVDASLGASSSLFLTRSVHRTNLGLNAICQQAYSYIRQMPDAGKIDILSISTEIIDENLVLMVLVRSYCGSFRFAGFYKTTDEEIKREEMPETTELHGELYIPEEAATLTYSEDDIELHRQAVEHQNEIRRQSTNSVPFLNRVNEYIPKKLPSPLDTMELTYKVDKRDSQAKLYSSPEKFQDVFENIMRQYGFNGPEYFSYISVIQGDSE